MDEWENRMREYIGTRFYWLSVTFDADSVKWECVKNIEVVIS